MFSAWLLSSVKQWCTLLLGGLLARGKAGIRACLRALLFWVLSAGPIPSHIAFIMDGNRRYADNHHVERYVGHFHGYDALLRTVKDSLDLRIKTVTLYAFAIDNFKRPTEEVSALMNLTESKLEALVRKGGLASMYGIRVRILGDLSLLPPGARTAAEKAMAVTSKNSSALLNLCISYTSTQEIVQSIQKTFDNAVDAVYAEAGADSAQDVSKVVEGCVTEEEIEKNLYTECCPPPDILIRTSGETRLSNFLLWQTSFSQLSVCKVLWPEFSFQHLCLIILEYQRSFRARAQRISNIKSRD